MTDTNNQPLITLLSKIRDLELELREHKILADQTTELLEDAIKSRRSLVSMIAANLDIVKISLAETVLNVTKYSRGGDDRNKVRQDAIDYFVHGPKPFHDLRQQYFGTKSYDRWYGQQVTHDYGSSPRHGSVIFRIELRPDARTRDLTIDEREACVYYLINLEKIQDAKK